MKSRSSATKLPNCEESTDLARTEGMENEDKSNERPIDGIANSAGLPKDAGGAVMANTVAVPIGKVRQRAVHQTENPRRRALPTNHQRGDPRERVSVNRLPPVNRMRPGQQLVWRSPWSLRSGRLPFRNRQTGWNRPASCRMKSRSTPAH